MNKRNVVFIVLTVTLAAVFAAAGRASAPRGPLGESEIRALVAQAPDEQEMADADALVLFDGVYVTHEDGRASVRRQRVIKMYTEYAIDELGDPRLAYDRSRQELVVHASRTYLLDGSVMDTPENGYNEVTPFGLDLSVRHLDIREMVVTHVGIERGVTVLLDWTVRDTCPAGLPFNKLYFMHDEFAALEKEVVAEGSLWGETVNPPSGLFTLPEPARSGGTIRWYATGLPKWPRHADEKLGDQIPWVALAASPDWEAMLDELGSAVVLAASERGVLESVLVEMEDDEPSLSERDALGRIAEEIAQRTEILRYEPLVFMPLPASADLCLRLSTATPVERCVIMIAAARVLGLQAQLVLPARWRSLSGDVPVLEALGNPLVLVDGGPAGQWFVDPVAGAVMLQAPFEGGVPYFVTGGRGVKRQTAPIETSNILLSVFWDLETGEAKADGSVSGPAAESLNWEEPEQLLKDWATGWPDSAEVGGIRVLASGPDGLTYAAGLKAPCPSPGERGRILLDLPMAPAEVSALLPPALNPAHSHIDGLLFPPAPALVRLSWKVRLPEGFLLLPAEDQRIEADGGSLTVTRSEKQRFVEVEYSFEWDGRPIHPDTYAQYRKLILDALDGRYRRLVLAEENSSDL